MKSCKKATELIEKKHLTKLSLMERIQLKAHLMMCDACSEYKKFSYLIEKKLKAEEHKNKTLSTRFKQNIIDSLN